MSTCTRGGITLCNLHWCLFVHPLVQKLHLYSGNLHCVVVVSGGGICIYIYIYTASARCTGQGTRCKGQDRRCKGQDQHQCKLVRNAATTFNYNHYQPGPTQHNAAITATCVRVVRIVCVARLARFVVG